LGTKAQGQHVHAYTSNRGMYLKDKKQGHVVKEYNLGNTKVRIADDYCRNKTSADVQATLTRIAKRAQTQLSAHKNK
jgi:hypothetical protein